MRFRIASIQHDAHGDCLTVHIQIGIVRQSRNGAREIYFGKALFRPSKKAAADIRQAFFDLEMITSLGCDSVINLLVKHDGALLGAVNMLHEEYHYRHSDLEINAPFGQILAQFYIQIIAGDPALSPDLPG